MRAQYEIVEDLAERLVIRDTGHAAGRMTVTNDAEAVVASLAPVLRGRRLLYFDSTGTLDELVHRDGAFVGFAPGPRSMPARPLVYVAAPYGASSPQVRERNRRRACALARLAVQEGLAPVVVHPGIELGAYGDDDVPEDRQRGLEVACRLVQAVAEAGGYLWLLEADDHRLSLGCGAELLAWEDATRDRALVVTRAPWRAWRARFRAAGLARLYRGIP